MIEKLKQLVREPLVHFLLIGAGIYGIYGTLGVSEDGDGERTVIVTAGDIQALSDQWTRMWNRQPTERELAGVIRDHVRVQILYREAVAMGLDAGDQVIERRLAQKVMMLSRGLITPEEPSDEALQAWYGENPDAFRQPDLYTITHIYFDRDSRGDSATDDARATLDKLQALETLPPDYSDYGDRFMLRNYYPSRTEMDLSKLFGSGFVEQIVDLEPGEWQGPVVSGYGMHLVLINDVSRSVAPDFEVVRGQIRDRWMAEQIQDLSDRFIDSLISRYDIVVEETQASTTAPVQGAAQ